MRAPVSRSRSGGSRFASRLAQALAMLSLLVSLVAPLVPAAPAAAAQPGGSYPPPLPAPDRVALSGSFQTAIGCPADFDPSCPQSQLQDNGDGSWSAALPIPPGDYTFRVVATSDAERSLGEGGDPNGNDLSLSVPPEAAGAYIAYDSLTGEISAEPEANLATLVTDLGEQYAMAPSRRGGYELTWDAQPGAYGFQVLYNGQPVAEDSVSLDSGQRVIVAVDDAGAVTTRDTLRDTTLEVSAVDEAGTPRVGSCFAIIDRDNRLVAQACDEDDGQGDGQVLLRAPDGLDDGRFTLRETFTPEDGTPAEDQQIDLGRGRFEAAAQSTADGEQAAEEPTQPVGEEPETQQPAAAPAGGPVLEPGDTPGRLTVLPVDASGQPLPGACFAIVEFGFEVCDDDLDGSVIFDAVPSAPLTLRQTVPPAGFAPVADQPITIDPTGARLTLPQEASGEQTPAEPAETPETTPAETPPVEPVETPQIAPAAANQVVLELRDRDGAPAPGGCWALTERGGSSQTVERCDGDDGAEDGRIVFDAVAVGRYRLDETATPRGFRPAESQGIEVVDGVPAQATIEYRAEEGQEQGRDEEREGPGRLVIDVADSDGNALPGTCFDLRGPQELTDVCDQQDDGRLNIPDIPAGEYTVTQTQAPEGFAPAAETTVTVPAGDTIELPIVNAPEGAEAGQETTPTPAAAARLVIDVRQEDGAPVADACVMLRDAVSDLSVCDETERDLSAEPGRIEIADVTPGDYTIEVIPPEGFTGPEPAPLQVVADQPTRIELVLTPAEAEQEAVNGSLTIRSEDSDGNPLPGACFTVEIPPGGQGFGPFCDDDGDGLVTIQGITPGPIAVIESTPPTDTAPADPATREIEIVAGEEAALAFTRGAAEQEQAQETDGTVEVRIVDAAGEPVTACVNLDGDAETFSVCDNDQEDRDEATGQLLIEDVIPGSYTLTLANLPEGVASPPEQTVEVAAGETSRVEFTVNTEAPETPEATGPGTLVIFVEDETGEPVGGTCLTLEAETEGLEDLTDVCDQGDDGRLNFPDLPAGDYTIVQTRGAANMRLADEQTVTVQPGQSTVVTLVNAPRAASETPTPEPEATTTPEPAETATPAPEATAEQPAAGGMLAIVNLAPDNTLLGGGCFSLTDAAGALAAERCDNDRGDFDGTPGVIAFGAMPGGTYTVTQTRAPEGFAPAASVQIDHGAEAQSVDIVSEPASEETGAVELAAFDDGGNPIGGQCYTLTGVAGAFGPYCDDGEGDASGDPGVLVVEGLPLGTYEATLETAPEESEQGVAQEQQTRQRRSVSVDRGGRRTRANFTVRAQQNRRGSLLIRVRDDNGNYLADACFTLTPEGDNQPAEEVCDNRNGDDNPSNGRILLTGLRTGRYTLTQTEAPNGFLPADDESVRVQAGSAREVAITNERERERPASLDVETIDRQGNLLAGACYALVKGNSSTEACDTESGEPGITRFGEIDPGAYVVRQIQPPDGGFTPAGAKAALLEAGQSATVTVTNEARPGSLLIRKTDQDGRLLGGACFDLLRDDRVLYSVCDNGASDGNNDDGVILLGTIAPGDYLLRETRTPSGFLPAGDQEITIGPNERNEVAVANEAAPPPERVGDLRVFKIDTQGRALAGSCFALLDGNGQLMRPTCDNNDGADDGVVLIEGVAIGDYTLRETRRPSADFESAADLAVTIRENQTVDVEVVNRQRTGRIFIRKADPNGRPLANACFDVIEDGGGAACTDANGELVFSDLVPGVYRVVETRAPDGFLVVSPIERVTVRPGSTTTLDVVDQPAPPPPDSGSLQVVKFFCPAAAGGGGIDFVDSSDPDGGGLARTAGCERGDASFGLDGPSTLDFRTGATGRFQTTLPTGDYVLTELSTGAAESLAVSINTLTTVVVVNYVEPESEEPATIDVIKYTCEPGFQGRVWADFAESCLSTESLTNNVSFRLSGMVSARRVTGDAGIGGATRFDGLPAGDYRLREETPAGTVAVYAFCGLDPAAPNGRAVGDTVALRLAAGQLVTCHWFNVPEDLVGDSGAISVYKFACPVTTPGAAFDWYGRCDPQGQGVRFSLAVWDGVQFAPVTVGATDGDGILRFTRLQPGLYDLQEVDATWCRAESDSVNVDGHVVVEAGERASIWIFNCVGAKNPPNTGAGPMWSGAALPGAVSAAGLAAGMLWPFAGLAALRRRSRGR